MIAHCTIFLVEERESRWEFHTHKICWAQTGFTVSWFYVCLHSLFLRKFFRGGFKTGLFCCCCFLADVPQFQDSIGCICAILHQLLVKILSKEFSRPDVPNIYMLMIHFRILQKFHSPLHQNDSLIFARGFFSKI